MAEVQRALVICSARRTGSGLLSSALWGTRLCGRPDEYFTSVARRQKAEAWGARTDAEYVDALHARTATPNGVVSAKVHDEHLGIATRCLGPGFAGFAPEVVHVRLGRRDKVRQAVSMYARTVTGRFSDRTAGDPAAPVALEYDADTLRTLVDECERADRTWDRFFDEAGIEPHRLSYEDDLEHDWPSTTLRVLGFVGVDPPPDLVIATDYRRQATAATDALVERYRAENGG